MKAISFHMVKEIAANFGKCFFRYLHPFPFVYLILIFFLCLEAFPESSEVDLGVRKLPWMSDYAPSKLGNKAKYFAVRPTPFLLQNVDVAPQNSCELGMS